jgi:hypothetical protein
MTDLFIERRSIPQDGSRRIIADGWVRHREAAAAGIAALVAAGDRAWNLHKAATEADERRETA